MSTSSRARTGRASRAVAAASVAALSAVGLTAAPAHASAPASPLDSCFAGFAYATAAGGMNEAALEEQMFDVYPYPGVKVSPGATFVEPVLLQATATTARMTTMVVTKTGDLQSVRSTMRNPDDEDATWVSSAPVRIGHGWSSVRSIALPGTADAPFMFGLQGGSITRYTLGAKRDGTLVVRTAPKAANSGYASVRSITWTRRTTLRGGVEADVLLGLDGGRLVEYTIPRVAAPRVTTEVLGSRGWGAIRQVHAGVCLTGSGSRARVTARMPILGVTGSTVRLYVDANNRDGSGRDIRGHGVVGALPRG